MLIRVGLLNYVAGALLMPYAAFLDAARALRHDVEALAARFGVSFEQACHRLSTLQRPGARGVPFFFVRVDPAGNVSKRFSAAGFPFARYGGSVRAGWCTPRSRSPAWCRCRWRSCRTAPPICVSRAP